MIVFDLECRAGGHRFEGWFGSSDAFAEQCAAGLLCCPVCGATDIAKAVMAPNVGRKGNQVPSTLAATAKAGPQYPPAAVSNAAPKLPPEAMAMLHAIAVAQAEAIKSSTWVGDKFADEARAMYYGESEHAPIHGQATPEQARELLEEGVAIAPLLIPVVAPEQKN